jgi:hypothetical protein
MGGGGTGSTVQPSLILALEGLTIGFPSTANLTVRKECQIPTVQEAVWAAELVRMLQRRDNVVPASSLDIYGCMFPQTPIRLDIVITHVFQNMCTVNHLASNVITNFPKSELRMY